MTYELLYICTNKMMTHLLVGTGC